MDNKQERPFGRSVLMLFGLDAVEGLREIGEDIVDVLGANRKPNGRGLDAHEGKLFLRHLRMRGGRGMND